jgi:hypothetical protein
LLQRSGHIARSQLAPHPGEAEAAFGIMAGRCGSGTHDNSKLE